MSAGIKGVSAAQDARYVKYAPHSIVRVTCTCCHGIVLIEDVMRKLLIEDGVLMHTNLPTHLILVFVA